jgi:hypothetical protein
MPVRKFVENNSPSQNFFYLRCGIQRGKIDAKKVYQKISGTINLKGPSHDIREQFSACIDSSRWRDTC